MASSGSAQIAGDSDEIIINPRMVALTGFRLRSRAGCPPGSTWAATATATGNAECRAGRGGIPGNGGNDGHAAASCQPQAIRVAEEPRTSRPQLRHQIVYRVPEIRPESQERALGPSRQRFVSRIED